MRLWEKISTSRWSSSATRLVDDAQRNTADCRSNLIAWGSHRASLRAWLESSWKQIWISFSTNDGTDKAAYFQPVSWSRRQNEPRDVRRPRRRFRLYNDTPSVSQRSRIRNQERSTTEEPTIWRCRVYRLGLDLRTPRVPRFIFVGRWRVASPHLAKLYKARSRMSPRGRQRFLERA